jgi:hypothetical protein
MPFRSIQQKPSMFDLLVDSSSFESHLAHCISQVGSPPVLGSPGERFYALFKFTPPKPAGGGIGLYGVEHSKNERIQQGERPLSASSSRTGEYKTNDLSHFLEEGYVFNGELAGSERIYFK